MFFGYMKSTPTTYVMQYRDGEVVREGAGLSFLYWKPATTLVAVPLSSADVPFAFNEVTRDFQPVTLQGQLTYRVEDPRRLAGLLDYSITPSGRHRSDDPEKLADRLVQAAQVRARAVVQSLSLREVLVQSDMLEARVLSALAEAESVKALGVHVMAFSVLSIAPTPEMARALEAAAREGLQREADEAIYARRNAAVEQERRIKESELATELVVEERQRQIREAKMAADISVEEQRAALMERWVQNERQSADARAYTLEKTLEPVKGVDWKTLLATSANGADPALHIALAFREMGENAQRIGELNVSPDLLRSLLPSDSRHRDNAPNPGQTRPNKPGRSDVHTFDPRDR
ncbi:SPFH domain-containing protein [Corallococcus carmarthensis]|uniref:SPFH domain-containing protein n=1 Tax=Corallococcus carmarthensis TaxID=2316728 RepID=A0A3A8K1V1_9BACT|nr:SPFH domain-containing protein [Corallococcus carmarthensis]